MIYLKMIYFEFALYLVGINRTVWYKDQPYP